MREIPSDRSIDNTLSFLFEGYRFVSNRCEQHQSDIFQTRLLFEKTICFRGESAAKVFYDTQKFSRQNAAPKRIQKTLFGEGGVQGLDGEAHRRRKQAFMSLMTPEHRAQLTELTGQQWQEAAKQWEQCDQVVLLYAAQEVLCQAACTWAGVPLSESEIKQRTRDIAAMIDGSGGVGPRHWRARWGRKQSEAWIGRILDKIRACELEVPENSATYVFAWYRNPDGNLVDKYVAAVELINVIRPIVAIARYITFAALALHEYPDCKQKLKDEADYVGFFTQEVRRFYPFFPVTIARVYQSFEWQEYYFPAGVKVLLDLYGTNHDSQLWENPDKFQPDRFRQWQENSFNFIPQGGGDHYINHRCAGEWITIQLMEAALNFLVNSIDYDVPKQDLAVSLSRLPTMPKSGFVMSNVRRI